MSVQSRTGTVKSYSRTGPSGAGVQIVMTFTDPPPERDETFLNVPESYAHDLLAAKLTTPPTSVHMTYEDNDDPEGQQNTISGITV